ncbi:hypothetical protein JGD92_22645 [Salmonella enterica subsp. enterica serovar Kentucky]|nr:hypothetical protein [Salmonella enterica subsp. enterica serovar Kentucky]
MAKSWTGDLTGLGDGQTGMWLAVRPPGLVVRPVVISSSSGEATVFVREVKVMRFSAYVLHDACFD